MRMLENIFDISRMSKIGEVCKEIFPESAVRMEKIISSGQTSPEGFFYDQEDDELVWRLSGEAKITFKEGADPLSMKAGDGVLISAHELHRVDYTSENPPCIWIAVFGKFGQDCLLKK